MPNVMAALPNIGGALCSTPQGLADATTRVPCSKADKTRNPLKCAGCLKLANRFQPLVGRRSPYCEDMWGRHCCLTSFFPIVDTCLNCEDIARQNCAMVPRWRLFGNCLGPAFPADRAQHLSDLHSKFALGPHHVSKYGIDIQSAAAEIRRGKKKEERNKDRNYRAKI